MAVDADVWHRVRIGPFRDLDRLNATRRQLRAAGIEISREEEMEGVGRFARVHDPEGNAIELWEPPVAG